MMSARPGTLAPENLTLLGRAEPDRSDAARSTAALSAQSRQLRTMFRPQGVGYLLSRQGA